MQCSRVDRRKVLKCGALAMAGAAFPMLNRGAIAAVPDSARRYSNRAVELKASYDASYAFRGKIDTDGFDHPQKVFDLTEELLRAPLLRRRHRARARRRFPPPARGGMARASRRATTGRRGRRPT